MAERVLKLVGKVDAPDGYKEIFAGEIAAMGCVLLPARLVGDFILKVKNNGGVAETLEKSYTPAGGDFEKQLSRSADNLEALVSKVVTGAGEGEKIKIVVKSDDS